MNVLLWGGAHSCWTKAGRSCPLFRWEKEQNQSQQPALSCLLSLWERVGVRADGAGKVTALTEGMGFLPDQPETPRRTPIPAFSQREKAQNPHPLRWLVS